MQEFIHCAGEPYRAVDVEGIRSPDDVDPAGSYGRHHHRSLLPVRAGQSKSPWRLVDHPTGSRPRGRRAPGPAIADRLAQGDQSHEFTE